MKRRAAALALCVLLVLPLASVPAGAAGNVYFTAAGNEILPLNDSTMPFWSGGYLYIASSIFTGQVNRSLGVACLPGNVSRPDRRILYGGERSLIFDLSRNIVQDSDGNITYLGAIQRNGDVFVPASVVANYFGLEYSVTPLSVSTTAEANYGALVWLRRPNFGLSEKEFINAGSSQIAMRYEQYLRDQEAAGQPDSSPGTVQIPSSGEGKNVYLCMEAGGGTAALLDVLDSHGAQAAFFCSLEFLETQGNLLRRMTARGQAVGLLVNARDPELPVEEQLEAGNRALQAATMGKTRLAHIQGGDEKDLRAAGLLGFSCLTADLDRSDSGLRDGARADLLLRQISARRGDSVTVWLADAAAAAGLRAFLSSARRAEDRCLALTETAA